jgi:hypothetical protein
MNGYATLGDIYGPSSGPTFDAATIVGESNAPSTTGQAIAGAGSGGSLQPVQLFKGLQGINPLVGLIVLVAVVLGYKFLREHKRAEEVREARLGLWFGIGATLWVAALLPLLKAILAKYQIPAVSAYVANA